MPTETITTASCARCGHALDPTADGDPCPSCGGTAAAIFVEVIESIPITFDLVEEYIPGDSERNAARRWRDADSALQALEEPFADSSRAALHDAQHRLVAVLVELQSLRETVIKQHGIERRVVDRVIDQSPAAIALAHDLGNVAKHGSPLRTVRSGQQPRFDAPRAVSSDGICTFRLDVEHGGVTVDAINVTRQAIDDWGRHLTSWRGPRRR